jgi:hypothetical protein
VAKVLVSVSKRDSSMWCPRFLSRSCEGETMGNLANRAR